SRLAAFDAGAMGCLHEARITPRVRKLFLAAWHPRRDTRSQSRLRLRTAARRPRSARRPWRGSRARCLARRRARDDDGSAGGARRRGKLLPGYAADLVVLDRDPWHDPAVAVVATMVAGRWVHNPPPWP